MAIEYFTKLIDPIPLNEASSANMIEFIKGNIIYKFGIPQSIMTDQGKLFTSKEFEDFATSIGFKLINSYPYYTQANGQAEASNKIIIRITKNKIREHPRKWQSVLNKTLWSYRIACHRSIKCSHYELVYGHEVVLSWEINIGSRRVL